VRKRKEKKRAKKDRREEFSDKTPSLAYSICLSPLQ